MNNLNAVGNALLGETQNMFDFLDMYNPGSTIKGIARLSLFKITMDEVKTMGENYKRNRDSLVEINHSRFPTQLARVLNEIQVSFQVREGVHQICTSHKLSSINSKRQ